MHQQNQNATLIRPLSVKSKRLSRGSLRFSRSCYGETIHTAKEARSIDTVSLYVGPAHQDNYIDYVIRLNPRRVLFNPGTENPAFESRLKAEGISAERACTLVLFSTNQY